MNGRLKSGDISSDSEDLKEEFERKFRQQHENTLQAENDSEDQEDNSAELEPYEGGLEMLDNRGGVRAKSLAT